MEFTDIVQNTEIDRKMCANFYGAVIDFEKNILYIVVRSLRNTNYQKPSYQENIDKMMNFRLFKYENYCKACTEWVHQGSFLMSKYARLINE